MEILGTLFLVLFISLIMGQLGKKIGLPIVVGQIVSGIILGPGLFNLVNQHSLSTFSGIGVILLMFLAGIECDIDKLKKFFKPSLLVGMLGVILPLFIFFIYGEFINLKFEDAIFLGIIFSATSVSITVEVLKEYKKLDSIAGITILGAAIVDDIISIVLLSSFNSIFGSKNNSQNIWITFLIQIIFLIFIMFVVKFIGPKLMQLVQKFNYTYFSTITALSLCLGMSFLADLVSLSTVLGAFFAGLSISKVFNVKNITNNIEQIGYNFFIPIFFVSIGLEIKFDGILNDWNILIIMTILAIITKWIGSGLGAKLTGLNFNDANLVGIGMISRGEMALIIAQIGVSSNLITRDIYSVIIMTIVLTTIISPILIKLNNKKDL
ncbi:sodium:proton antiporter [Lactobacillus sp. S2-2]|uniref:cation:proton antiporter n=1 Tax=Lactobacillus sp. S2-2 TaxID=2692917 RepID=UPI001F1F3561|nr:cation:proton antiporter [Lactobacillus sp. S2-2]MCF6515741.1 sodium:proton antiporter [Lactobacillus sp. S2-2]